MNNLAKTFILSLLFSSSVLAAGFYNKVHPYGYAAVDGHDGLDGVVVPNSSDFEENNSIVVIHSAEDSETEPKEMPSDEILDGETYVVDMGMYSEPKTFFRRIVDMMARTPSPASDSPVRTPPPTLSREEYDEMVATTTRANYKAGNIEAKKEIE